MADKLVPKNISEQKLKAFSIGTTGTRSLSKRELEELRKKEQEEAAAHAFQEFVETFQDIPINDTNVWVKAGTYYAGTRKEDTREKRKLYKPQSRLSRSQESLSFAERARECARLLSSDRKPERLGRKRIKDKSNLETFKEELRQIQEEREERYKYKGSMKSLDSDVDLLVKFGDTSSFDNSDPTTTNLYLGNLNPKITEQELMEVFGKFGPLASIKIMWPRSDEGKARDRNCGFVAFMNRKDGERALRNLNGKEVMSYEMKLGWGKSIIIPPHPIYIPPALLELSIPPPPSGLPFNAQPNPKDKIISLNNSDDLDYVLDVAQVKVVIPTDRNVLMLIHRMVEFVIREGPLFEAMIMKREINNPLFRFLFDNKSPGHIYYRWKLYSMMQGDTQKEWSLKEFRMFKGGSIWKPPIMNVYTQGMPPDLVDEEDTKKLSKGFLSNTQRDRLEDLIRNLSPEKKKIGEVMVFCIEHSEAAEEITECIYESLSSSSTLLYKKISRLYLVSDILHNCGVKINNASYYRKAFESRLVNIMRHMNETCRGLEGRLKAEGFKVRVFKILKAWDNSAIYTPEFLHKLHNAFLGLVENNYNNNGYDPRLDGIPLDDDNDFEEGIPMDSVALLKEVMKLNVTLPSPIALVNHDIDGSPLNSDVYKYSSKLQRAQSEDAPSGFIPSKWETIDPDQVVAQSMTMNKWNQFENSAEDNSVDSTQNDVQDNSDTADTRNTSEERRLNLREIEMKAMQYQDELESGQRSLKSGWTILQQVEHYRRKLLRKFEKKKLKAKGSSEEKHPKDWSVRCIKNSLSPDDSVSSARKKKRSRSSSQSSQEHRTWHSKSPTVRITRHTRSPGIKMSIRAPSPPTHSRIRGRFSPSVSSSKQKRNRGSPNSPSNEKNSMSPWKLSKRRIQSPSPPRSSSKHSRRKSPSSISKYKLSPTHSPRPKYENQSPEIQTKYRDRHKY